MAKVPSFKKYPESADLSLEAFLDKHFTCYQRKADVNLLARLNHPFLITGRARQSIRGQ